VDQRLHIVLHPGDGDHGAAVGVPDEHDGPVDLPDDRGDVGGVAGERQVRDSGCDDRDLVGEQLGDHPGEAGGIGERAVDENDGGSRIGHGQVPPTRLVLWSTRSTRSPPAANVATQCSPGAPPPRTITS
jgi:hypothetical protein